MVEKVKLVNLQHGLHGTRTYRIWGGMLTRCRNHNDKSYLRYGARGITVCNRWLNFANFLTDMGVCPDGLTIDRINNDGNYEPGNCRWATWTQQARNRSNSKPIMVGAVPKLPCEWDEAFGFVRGTAARRFSHGRSIDSPVNKKLSRPQKREAPNSIPIWREELVLANESPAPSANKE